MECRHIFSNGQRCRCRATDRHVFCRQHAPQPRVPTLRNCAIPFRRWIDLRRALPTLDRAEIPPAILFVLDTLLQEGPRGISDRSAGALLRALLRRFGQVPFTLPDDPVPEPDYAFTLSQSMDRLTDLIRRYTGYPAARLSNPPIDDRPSRVIARANPSRSPAESTAVPHSTPRGRGWSVD